MVSVEGRAVAGSGPEPGAWLIFFRGKKKKKKKTRQRRSERTCPQPRLFFSFALPSLPDPFRGIRHATTHAPSSMEDVPDSKDYSFPGEELKILEFWDEVRIAGGGKNRRRETRVAPCLRLERVCARAHASGAPAPPGERWTYGAALTCAGGGAERLAGRGRRLDREQCVPLALRSPLLPAPARPTPTPPRDRAGATLSAHRPHTNVHSPFSIDRRLQRAAAPARRRPTIHVL